MPLYRVELIRVIRVSVRRWEFEAKDEAEVRKLYQEAKKQKISGVIGYELSSITEIK